MFGFLKDRLKKAIDSFSKKAEEKQEVQEKPSAEVEDVKPEAPKEQVERAEQETISEETVSEQSVSEKEEKPKKGLFGRLVQKIGTKKISREEFNSMFDELEMAMLENNIAVEVVAKIKEELSEKIIDKLIRRKDINNVVSNCLMDSISRLFIKSESLVEIASKKKPFVICFIGVNGSGKTTTIAKVAHLFLKNKLVPVIAAADTFRAAAIDQLKMHADRLNVRFVSHQYMADAAAVAFDAIQHAKSTGKDVVLIDTAGRLHSNKNLMEEMKKIIKVAKPDLKIFVGESITGNDCIEQARQFDSAIGIDGIILSKADVDEKGGTAISISYVLRKPIFYVGVGQEYEDLKQLNSEEIISALINPK
ncbi:signal recognition particle-docking protein FtsY [Candidatus Woesearchaeota archaeon]|nr:signal recognition particle-docking protein FtsY [Candidatus Woesearchaeota archaeon]